MNNKIIELQEILMNEIKRLDDNTLMLNQGAEEVARSNAITNGINTYLKAVNVNIRIMEIADKNEMTKNSLNSKLGLQKDEN